MIRRDACAWSWQRRLRQAAVNKLDASLSRSRDRSHDRPDLDALARGAKQSRWHVDATVARCPARTAEATSVRACVRRRRQHDRIGRLALLIQPEPVAAA